MEHKLEWLTKEEGRLVFLEKKVPFLTMKVFVMGEEAAEFQLQDVVWNKNKAKNDSIQEEVTLKMTECISEAFRLLWDEGFEETILVEQQGTKNAEILDSTGVVRLLYSEYMMTSRFDTQKSTDCGRTFLKLTKTETGYDCENEEQTFFCRLMSYEVSSPRERSFYLYEVEVKEDRRNQGIASACLEELFRYLAEELPVFIMLQVGSYNEPAVHLYKKLGFEVSEELRYYAATEE